MMNAAVKRFQGGIDGEKLWRRVKWIARVRWVTDRKLVDDYLRGKGPHKLHLGCGHNVRPGWLNSDYYPPSDSVLHVDATAPFPLPDASLDYVFSEHMIEHLSYPDGMRMCASATACSAPAARSESPRPISTSSSIYIGRTNRNATVLYPLVDRAIHRGCPLCRRHVCHQ